MSTKSTKRLWVKFNPKKLPLEKVTTCKGEDHEGTRRNHKCRLTMQYYDDETKQQFAPNTERYLCDECYDAEII